MRTRTRLAGSARLPLSSRPVTEAMACLTKLAAPEGFTAAQFTAIAAFSSAVLGYFDWQTKDYRRNLVDEHVEVASLTGDIAVGDDGTPSLHTHCVLGRRDGTALAGHLIEGTCGRRLRSSWSRVRPIHASVMTGKVASR
jgi:predicted DNA-binding protein with PD1-like motif